ncbi:ISL3 family transposase, partial [Bacillus salacetis]
MRRRVQKDFHPYDRKKCKRMKHIFHKPYSQLNDRQHWYLERYLGLSEELRTAYALKEAYRLWFEEAKEIGTSAPNKVKEGLYNFYRQVESSSLKEFHQAIQT